MNITISILCLILFINLTESKKENTNKWCPSVKCKTFGDCRPCDKKFLFIISQGRSGGTTIKNMINLLPGVRIGGEIGNTLMKMIEIWNYVRTGPDNNLKRGRGHFEGPWGHNNYPEQYLACPAQDLIESINPPKNIEEIDDSIPTILGFKEIRLYNKRQYEFLITYFPCSRFIFSIRSDTKALKKSQENLASSDYYNDEIIQLYNWIKKSSPQADNRLRLMDLDKWSEKSVGQQYFNDLASWLGFENCTYPDILHDSRVVDHAWTMDQVRLDLGPSCRRRYFD